MKTRHKAIVSYSDKYVADKYHSNYILTFLQHEHLRMNTALVEERRKKGIVVKRFVTKKRLRQEVAPPSKEFITDFTTSHRELFANFKREKNAERSDSLINEELAPCNVPEVAGHLIQQLTQIPSGTDAAPQYERAIAGILELLFYPSLMNPDAQTRIHGGRKRIDITYDNAASEGFFFRLHNQHNTPSPFIFVECKNYSSDPANPELDQLSGRFSPNRGQFGLLVCRTIIDMNLFLNRCADTFGDSRGTIIPLVDLDLVAALTQIRDGHENPIEAILQQRFRQIALQ